nr:hypothetical protein [Tanacetum cinerariifolium]
AGLEIASDADSEGEVVSADDAIPAGVFVSAGDVAAAIVSPHSEKDLHSWVFLLSDRSLKPSTNDFQTYDSSQECSRPNHSDHDSISSVSAPTSESRDTIVI